MSALKRPNTSIPKAGKGGGLKKIRKPLVSLQSVEDPINEDAVTGNVEQDAAQELTDVQAGFRERMKQEQERFLTATDSSYYFSVVFESGEQASAFLQAVGLDGDGDLFIDGRELADVFGVELPEANVNFKRQFGPDKKLAKLAKPLK